jgi:hypothetical protein
MSPRSPFPRLTSGPSVRPRIRLRHCCGNYTSSLLLHAFLKSKHSELKMEKQLSPPRLREFGHRSLLVLSQRKKSGPDGDA